MTKPLTPSELKEVLAPNPWWWGKDAYPVGTFFGVLLVADPAVQPGSLQCFDEDGRRVGYVVDVGHDLIVD